MLNTFAARQSDPHSGNTTTIRLFSRLRANMLRGARKQMPEPA